MYADKNDSINRWPVFVLSLVDAVERREQISTQLSDLGIAFDFVDAIDGRNGLPAEYEVRVNRAVAKQVFGRELSDAEYACALSHQHIYDLIIEGKQGGGIILEDDVAVDTSFRDFLDQRTYMSAGLIQLQYVNCWVWRSGRKSTAGDLSLAKVATDSLGAGAYSISAETAHQIKSMSFPISRTADWPCDMSKVDRWVTVPEIAFQTFGSGGSQLMGPRKKARRAVSRTDWIGFRLRRFLRASYWRRWYLKRTSTRIA